MRKNLYLRGLCSDGKAAWLTFVGKAKSISIEEAVDKLYGFARKNRLPAVKGDNTGEGLDTAFLLHMAAEHVWYSMLTKGEQVKAIRAFLTVLNDRKTVALSQLKNVLDIEDDEWDPAEAVLDALRLFTPTEWARVKEVFSNL